MNQIFQDSGSFVEIQSSEMSEVFLTKAVTASIVTADLIQKRLQRPSPPRATWGARSEPSYSPHSHYSTTTPPRPPDTSPLAFGRKGGPPVPMSNCIFEVAG